MLINIILLFTVMCLSWPTRAAAQSNKLTIVADTPVTHSLVTMITGDLAQPAVLISNNASPHHYALRPSDAKHLQAADLIVWTSASLTPWLDKAMRSLAPDALSLELMASTGTLTLPFRNNTSFEHNHDTETTVQKYKVVSSNTQDNAHAHTNLDPHGWLDPINAIVWLTHIEQALTESDPSNSSTYRQNAESARARLETLNAEITATLANHSDKPFVVFHDSYQYFESRYSVNAVSAISASDATQPGIKHMKEMRNQLSHHEAACVFSEPQFSDKLIKTVTEGRSYHAGILDPMGTSQAPGPELYPSMMQAVAQEMSRCFSQSAQ